MVDACGDLWTLSGTWLEADYGGGRLFVLARGPLIGPSQSTSGAGLAD